jgi:hypothetical protein
MRMSSGLMRSHFLVLVMLLFTVAGTASIVLGVTVLIDNARDADELTSLVGVNLGLAILSTTALWLFMLGVLSYIVTPLAYIATTLTDAVEARQKPALRSAPVLPDQPRPPWYTEPPVQR